MLLIFAMLKKLLLLLTVILSQNANSKDFNGLYYNTFGKSDDPSIIFIHGGPGHNSYDFEATTAKNLSNLGYFVIVYDQRGQGRSQTAAAMDYNYKTYSDDLKSLIDKFGLKNPILIGHSHGGSVAIHFEKQYPNIAKKIVLLAAPLYLEGIMRAMLENCSLKAQETNNNELASASAYLYQHLVVNPVGDLETKTNLAEWLFNMGLNYCGLYNVKSPTVEEAEVKKGFKIFAKQNDVAGSKGLGEFLKNENYLYQDQTPFVSENRSRFCGIYGNEDGLFTPLELQHIRSILNGVKVKDVDLVEDGVNRFKVISGASHAIYINQQGEFFNSLKSVCGI